MNTDGDYQSSGRRLSHDNERLSPSHSLSRSAMMASAPRQLEAVGLHELTANLVTTGPNARQSLACAVAGRRSETDLPLLGCTYSDRLPRNHLHALLPAWPHETTLSL